MIAALIIFGLMAAIALLIPVSFKIINFILGYKKFQRRDGKRIIAYVVIFAIRITGTVLRLAGFAQQFRLPIVRYCVSI